MDSCEYRENLKDGIERKALCQVRYLHTQPVRLVEDGRVTWSGKVEVFQLDGHTEAKQAFGWGIPNGQGKMEYFTVIGRPPLDSAIQAVKAYLASRRS